MNLTQNGVSAHTIGSILDNYSKTLNNLKEKGKPIIGYFTNRVPVEILHAMNLHPVRILSFGQQNQGASERYLQTFACSWLCQIMDIGLAQGYDTIDGIIFSAGTCDSLQNLSDIWKKVFPDQWTHNLTFPVLTNNSLANEYLQSEFEILIEVLSSRFLKDDTEIKLSSSIKLYNKKRANLLKIADLVSVRKMKYKEFAKLLLFSDILPVETVNEYLEKLIAEVLDFQNDAVAISPRILLVGGMYDNYRLFEVPEFDYLVADDLAFGTRNFNFQIPQDSFLPRYSKAYMDRIPESTSFDMNKRIKFLEELIKGHNIDGIVLLGLKWCDPDAFEFIPIQNYLNEQNIPYLKLETSPDISNLQQIKTRMAAFIEMLS